MRDVELVFDGRAELAEGPCWLADQERLLWVDIMAGRVHLLDPVTGDDRSLEVGQPVGAAVPATDGRLALAVRDGFAMLDPGTGTVEHVMDERARAVEPLAGGIFRCRPGAAGQPTRSYRAG